MLFVHIITTQNPLFCVVKYNVLNLIMTKVQLLCYGLTIIRDFTDNILVFNNTHNANINLYAYITNAFKKIIIES